VVNASHWVVQGLDYLIPPRRGLVACHSSPDFDDMILALLAETPATCSIAVLADDKPRALRRMRDLQLPPVHVQSKRSLRGLFTYLRSEHSVSTHGLFGARRRGRRKSSSTPWHGEFSKQIGTLIGQPGKYFDIAVVSTPQSKFQRSTEFALAPQHIHVVGTPRQSTLAHGPRADRAARLKGRDRWLLFAPTYRQSKGSALDVDSALSMEYQEESLGRLDQVVRSTGGTLWVRPHPVAEPYSSLPPTARMATDDDLQRLGLTLYDMLGATDLLITDYSSIWIDFLAKDRPVIAFCPDIEDYRDARGLALEPYEAWFPGPVVTSADELCAETARLLEGHDDHRSKRSWVRSVLCPDRPEAARAYWSLLLDDRTARRRRRGGTPPPASGAGRPDPSAV